ncbi:MAG: DUF922 domain-containing protein [Algibacter sp.]
MIKFFLAICCFLCVPKDSSVMSWTESYKLTWEDFKGEPNYNFNSVAITASGISFSYSIKENNNSVVDFKTEVYANFFPEKSWYKKELANPHILNHEQLHYDITELFARKFRKELEGLSPNNGIKKTFNKINNTINKELGALQDLYDTETNHSINVEAQTKWQLYITEELEKLSQYKSVDSQP